MGDDKPVSKKRYVRLLTVLSSKVQVKIHTSEAKTCKFAEREVKREEFEIKNMF